MRWTEHVALMVKGGIHTGFWWKNRKEREYVDVRVRVILKGILERSDGAVQTRLIGIRIGTNGGFLKP